MKKLPPFFLTLVVVLLASISLSAQEPPPQPVTINFNELTNNTLLADQYLPKVYFSARNFRAGIDASPYGKNLYALSYPGFFDVNKSIVCLNNSDHSYSNQIGEVYVSFTVPVNNLHFNILNFYSSYSNFPAAYIEIYRNGSLYQYFQVYGIFQNYIPVDLSAITNITDIKIYANNNVNSFFQPIPMYFDDFSFTPDLNITISNSNVLPPLTGTQKAMVGADFTLNTSVNRAGGTYTWTATGPFSLVSDGSTGVIRATDPGTGTAKVTYTLNGFTATAQITINAILPTLNTFTGTYNVVDQITRDQYCSGPGINGIRYSFGCFQDGGPNTGVVFSATAQIPPGPYLTDLSQSGIKIKQFRNKFIKRVNATPPYFSLVPPTGGAGNIECSTSRTSESNVDSGWAIEEQALSILAHSPPRFSPGTTSIQAVTFSSPADSLDTSWLGYRETHDTFFADDRYQTYVYYFVGSETNANAFQRPLKLSSQSALNFSYIGWKRNGQTVFNYVPSTRHSILFSNTPSLFTSGTNLAPAENPLPMAWGQCPGDNATPSTLPIDGSRCFVFRQYQDFLNRTPDVGGWNFWRTQIANCLFDRACVASKRAEVAFAFFTAAEFQQIDPNMANPPGSPNFNPTFYNPAFVDHCYNEILRRPPEPGPGRQFWI